MPKAGRFIYEEVNKRDQNGNVSDACIILEYDGDNRNSLFIPSTLGGLEVIAIDRLFWKTIPVISFLSIPKTVTDLFYDEKRPQRFNPPDRAYLNGLREIRVDKENQTFHSFDGALYISGEDNPTENTTLYIYPPRGDREAVFLPDGCTRIADYALQNADKVREFHAPNVKYAGKGVFSGCSNLESLSCPSVSEFGPLSFKGCKKLASITIGKESIPIHDLFRGSPCHPVIQIESDALRKYCYHKDFILKVDKDGIEAVYYQPSSCKVEVYIPSIVTRFDTDIFPAGSGIRTVVYAPATVRTGEDIPGISFVCRKYPDVQVQPIQNTKYILYLPQREMKVLNTGNAIGFGEMAFRNCRIIQNLFIGKDMESSQIAGLLANVTVGKIYGLDGHNLSIKENMIFDKRKRFICTMAGYERKSVVCRRLSGIASVPSLNISSLVIDFDFFSPEDLPLSRFPKLKWLFFRVKQKTDVLIQVSDKYSTVVYLDSEGTSIGRNVRLIKTSKEYHEVCFRSEEDTGCIVCLKRFPEMARDVRTWTTFDELFSDKDLEDPELKSCLLHTEENPDGTQGAEFHNRNNTQPSGDRAKLHDDSGGIVVPTKQIIIVTQKFGCIKAGHSLMDVKIKVRIIRGSNLTAVGIPGGYCKECDRYYVYSSVFEDFLRNNLRLGCEILQNRFKMPDGRLYGSMYETSGTMKSESLLKRCGYTVGITAGLNDRTRISLLRQIISMKLMTRQEIMSYLNYFISFNGQKAGNEYAKMQWEKDLQTISGS